MKLQNTVGKQITTLAGIKRKISIGRETRLIIRKIKEVVRSFKNPNHIKISYMLPEIWLPNLR